MANTRDNWTIRDYIEELYHLRQMDELPWIDKRIAELLAEMKQKFAVSQLLDNGLTYEDILG